MKKNLSPLLLGFLLFFLFQPAFMAGADERPLLKKITFTRVAQDREEVIFTLNGTYIPKVFAIKGKKPRVVFDFYGVGQAFTVPNTMTAGGKYVQRIRVGRHGGKSPKTRGVLDLVYGKKIQFSQDFDKTTNTLAIVLRPDTAQNMVDADVQSAKTKRVQERSLQQTTEQRRIKAENTKRSVPQVRQPHPEPASSLLAQQDSKAMKSGTMNAGHDQAYNNDAQQIAEQQNQPQTVLTGDTESAEEPVKTPAASVSGTTKPDHHLDASAEQRDENRRHQAEAVPALSTDSAVLESIVFENNPTRGEMVQFSLTRFHPPELFGIEEGVPRIICDFPETKPGKKLPKSIKTNGRWIKVIRIGSHQNPDRVRVVFDLAPGYNYDLQQVFFKEENVFALIVNAGRAVPAAEFQKQNQSR